MPNLVFPQLSSGCLAQYPIRKVRAGRTLKNELTDGNLILLPDPGASRLVWELGYSSLSTLDLDVLTAHFAACAGRLRAFTFIDPTDNMLVNSSTLSDPAWQAPSSIQIATGAEDPVGGQAAFMVTNTGQTKQEITQILAVPSSYQFCFSVFAWSTQPDTVELIRRGSQSDVSAAFATGPDWKRLISTGKLSDPGATFTVGISLRPGQQVLLYGPQCEPQIAPSRYRATSQTGGVYRSAHWGTDQLPVSADGPGMFSTTFSIEAALI